MQRDDRLSRADSNFQPLESSSPMTKRGFSRNVACLSDACLAQSKWYSLPSRTITRKRVLARQRLWSLLMWEHRSPCRLKTSKRCWRESLCKPKFIIGTSFTADIFHLLRWDWSEIQRFLNVRIWALRNDISQPKSASRCKDLGLAIRSKCWFLN